jgi:CubicO group peptidase (beta-lactamase class C family)
MDSSFWWTDIPRSDFAHLQSYDNEYKVLNDTLIPKRTPLGTVHDTKAQILKVSGHAGIFSTPKDLSKFCFNILSGNIISQKSLEIMSLAIYDYYIDNQRFGLLCYKKASDIIKSEVPYYLSEAAFAMSGYTGTYLVIDPENNYYASINSNRIYNRAPSCQGGYIYGKSHKKIRLSKG